MHTDMWACGTGRPYVLLFESYLTLSRCLLEFELIQTHMTQKPLLRVEVDAHIGWAQAGKTLNFSSVQEGGCKTSTPRKKPNEDKGLQRPAARFIRPFGALFRVFRH